MPNSSSRRISAMRWMLRRALGELEVRVVLQPAREGVDDLRARQPQPARAAHGQDEGKAEAARCSRR
jgi:hypothetical protein